MEVIEKDDSHRFKLISASLGALQVMLRMVVCISLKAYMLVRCKGFRGCSGSLNKLSYSLGLGVFLGVHIIRYYKNSNNLANGEAVSLHAH